MEDISLNGDSYTTAEALFKATQRNDRRLSLILGGAGTGKTTLVQAIVFWLCALCSHGKGCSKSHNPDRI